MQASSSMRNSVDKYQFMKMSKGINTMTDANLANKADYKALN